MASRLVMGCVASVLSGRDYARLAEGIGDESALAWAAEAILEMPMDLVLELVGGVVFEFCHQGSELLFGVFFFEIVGVDGGERGGGEDFDIDGVMSVRGEKLAGRCAEERVRP